VFGIHNFVHHIRPTLSCHQNVNLDHWRDDAIEWKVTVVVDAGVLLKQLTVLMMKSSSLGVSETRMSLYLAKIALRAGISFGSGWAEMTINCEIRWFSSRIWCIVISSTELVF
jgi:hypothetical protein